MSFKDLFVIEEEKEKVKENENDIFQQNDHQLPSPSNENERIGGILSHISAFLGYFIPFGNILGPLAIWIFMKDKDGFVRENAKSALNFQCTFTIYSFIGLIIYLR